MCAQSLSRVRLVTPWAIACQAPLSMGFSRQEYWSGLPFPSPGDLPDPRIQPTSLQLTQFWSFLWLSNMPLGFPAGSVVKNPPANAGDADSTPGSGRSSGEGNGNPHQYSCLGNPMDRGAWQAIAHGVTRESNTT